MEKRLIATRADDGEKAMTDLTFPIIKKYAEKCSADFIILNSDLGLHHHYRILQFYELFEKYDRILSLDADTLIFNNCPNIFKFVPKEKIGTIYEDKGSRQADRQNRIKMIQEKFGNIGWKDGYINTGFAVFSKEHKEIFKPVPEEELWMDLGYDDVYLGYQINKLKLPVRELYPIWNFMSMFAESWSDVDVTSVYVVHYAGQGFQKGVPRAKQIGEDILTARKYGII